MQRSVVREMEALGLETECVWTLKLNLLYQCVSILEKNRTLHWLATQMVRPDDVDDDPSWFETELFTVVRMAWKEICLLQMAKLKLQRREIRRSVLKVLNEDRE